MEKNEITREKLNAALNLVKSEYISNKQDMQDLDEESKTLEVQLKYNYAKKQILEGKLSTISTLNKFFYIQIVAFALATIASIFGASIFVSLFVGGVTIAETVSYRKRSKEKIVVEEVLSDVNNKITKLENSKKQLDSCYVYCAEKDLNLSKKIDCLQNYVFDHKHSDIFDLNEIFEKTSKIEQEHKERLDKLEIYKS